MFNPISERLPHEWRFILNLRWDQRIEIWPRKTINQQCNLPYLGCTKGNASFPCTTNSFTQTLIDH
jgi:hypothetical protein